MVEQRTCISPTQVRFPGAAKDFSRRINFHCRLSYGIRTPLCAIACICICAHVKDPVAHVRGRWITERQHPACAGGWVARLCRSWLSSRKATRISHGIDPNGTTQFIIIIIINPLTASVVGAPQMISQPDSFIFPVLNCPMGLGELQSCQFPDVVFPPLPLSALSSSPFHCALQDGFGQT